MQKRARCRSSSKKNSLADVVIAKGADMVQNVRSALKMNNWVDESKLPEQIVLLKPNLTGGSPTRLGETTTIQVVDAAARHFLDLGSKVIIGEGGSGIYSASQNYQLSGYIDHFKKLGIPCVDLSKTEFRNVGIPNSEQIVPIPKIALDSCLIVSIPVIKLHFLSKVTISLKNVGIGMIAETCKMAYHRYLDTTIAGVNSIVGPTLTIVDGTWGLEKSGPFHGQPVKLDFTVVGIDSVAVDSVCCRIIGIDPTTVSHIRRASEPELGLGKISPDEMRIIGNSIDEVYHPFIVNLRNPFYQD